jgi:hypothetical protein
MNRNALKPVQMERAFGPELSGELGEADSRVSRAYRAGEVEELREALPIGSNRYFFTLEESRAIRKRIMESPEPGPEREAEFHLFLECLRRNADLYASLLFGRQQTKLIAFDLSAGWATVRDETGDIHNVNLTFDKL